MATTQAAEDSTWLLLVCSAEKRLSVSLVHNEQFPFPLKPSSFVQLRSNNVPAFSIQAKMAQDNLLFLDPRPLRELMPRLLQDSELVISFPELDGTMHTYSFSVQPNDMALKPIRSGCFES
jgi:hypothetical protein